MAASLEDYYSILRVPQSATYAQIKESYKRLALLHHPDKNPSNPVHATQEFQSLVRAWECLKDEKKRREYDGNYWIIGIELGVGGNMGSTAAAGGSRGGKRKWEWDWKDDERQEEHSKRKKEYEARSGETASQNPTEAERKANEERMRKAKAWKATAQQNYFTRLKAWETKRTTDSLLISQLEQEISNYQNDLAKQTRETDSEITSTFHTATKKSLASVKDKDLILRRILSGRKEYAQKLTNLIQTTRTRLHQSIETMKVDWQKYELSETDARRDSIREALGILGPRDSRSSGCVFNVLDRRQRTMNYWNALARVKISVPNATPIPIPIPIPTSLIHSCKGGPWHSAGSWERLPGEQTCGICQETSFQLVPECAAAECPGCGLIACNGCWRDLKLLREYSEWLSNEKDGESLFGLGFDGSDNRKEGHFNGESTNFGYEAI